MTDPVSVHRDDLYDLSVELKRSIRDSDDPDEIAELRRQLAGLNADRDAAEESYHAQEGDRNASS